MRCEIKDCKKKAKLKLSTPNGWVVRWCFKHTMFSMKGILRNVVRWNSALYVQKDPDS